MRIVNFMGNFDFHKNNKFILLNFAWNDHEFLITDKLKLICNGIGIKLDSDVRNFGSYLVTYLEDRSVLLT